MSDKNKYSIETEELAVPEIHTGKHDIEKEDRSEEKEIVYDQLAVPEIHIKNKKK